MNYDNTFKYSIPVTFSLIAYFLILQLLGLGDMPLLRFLNAFILLGGLYTGIKYFRDESTEHFTYLKGLGRGIQITIASVIPFVAFLWIYLTITGAESVVNFSILVGNRFSPISISLATALEGLASGSILSFMLMQFMKDPIQSSSYSQK